MGDGLAFVVDLPFAEELIYNHIDNNTIHVTAEEKQFWNNKVRGIIEPQDPECLFLTTN